MLAAMRRRAVVACAVAVLAAPRAARAYRPFDQTDGDTAEFGTIELELGPLTLTRGDGQTTYQPGGVFNYGFSPGWELVVDYDAYIPVSDPGALIVPTDVMVKHVLRAGSLQGLTGPSIALELGPLLPQLPLPSNPSTPDDVGWSADLIVSQRWSDFTIHVNGQFEYTRDRQLEYTGGAIVEGPDRWRLRPVGEGYVQHEDGGNLYSGLAGVLFRFRDNLTFDAALRAARDENHVTSGQIRVGLTWVIST